MKLYISIITLLLGILLGISLVPVKPVPFIASTGVRRLKPTPAVLEVKPECPVCSQQVCIRQECEKTYKEEYERCEQLKDITSNLYKKFEPLHVSMLSVINPARWEAGVYDCSEFSEALIQELDNNGIRAVRLHGTWNGTPHAWVGVMIESEYGRFIKTSEDYKVSGGTTVFRYCKD